MKIKIKKLNPSAIIPKYAKSGDACVDLVATSDPKMSLDTNVNYIEYDTGLSFEIPEGYVGLLFPRSSVSNASLTLCNSVGVVDAGYRGEVKFRFYANRGSSRTMYKKGDRIGQLMVIPIPTMEFEEVEDLSSSDRGAGGFGSSGK